MRSATEAEISNNSRPDCAKINRRINISLGLIASREVWQTTDNAYEFISVKMS